MPPSVTLACLVSARTHLFNSHFYRSLLPLTCSNASLFFVSAFIWGKSRNGAPFLALHSLCIDGFIFLLCNASRTLHWHIERGEGWAFFLIARMVYPFAQRGLHPHITRGLYTWLLRCFLTFTGRARSGGEFDADAAFEGFSDIPDLTRLSTKPGSSTCWTVT
ncbi:hypothetical protein BDW71DRAFT_143541 [Aspergillus fruticulosus]